MKKSAMFMMVLLFAAPLFAQDRNVHITVWASQVDMQGDNDLEGGFTTEFDDGKALGASANVFMNRYLSVEASVFGIRSDAALAFEGTTLNLGKIDLVPVTLGVQLHPFGDSRFDPYVGAGGAYVMADDLNSADLDILGLGRIELENELTYYLNAGIGIQIGSGFGVVIDGRYIPYETSSRSTATGVAQDLELAPRMLSVGLRLKF